MGFWSKIGEGKNYRLVNSPKLVSWLFNSLKSVDLCAIDIETSHRTSLDMAGQHDVRVGGIAFSWQKDQGAYLPLYTGRGEETWWKRDDVFEAILQRLADFLASPCEKVGHNVKFDVAWIYRCFGIVTQNVVFDTMLAHHALDEEGALTCRHGLKPMAKYYLDPEADRYEHELKSALEHYDPVHKRYTEVDLDILYPYACSDVDYTLQLMHILEPQLEAQGLTDLFYDVVMPLQHCCMLAEISGMTVDLVKNAELSSMYRQKLEELRPKIYELAGFQFDLNSAQQVADVLYSKLNLPVQFGKKGQVTTDKEALERLKDSHPMVSVLHEYRSIEKLNTSYVEGVRKRIDPVTQKLHPTFLIHGTVTGRLSTEDPNVQNWPRPEHGGLLIKSMFLAGPDRKIVMADYSQIELRVAAHCSREPVWVESFCRGVDLHSQTAKKCYNLDCDVGMVKKLYDEYRSRAKAVNFGILYGMTEFGLAPRLKMDVDAAREFIDLYFAGLPTLKNWILATHALAKQQGYVTNIFGRRRRLPDIQYELPKRLSKPAAAPSCWGNFKQAPPILKTFFPGFTFKTHPDIFDAGKFQSLARELAAKRPNFHKCAGCYYVATCAHEVERSFRQKLIKEAERQAANTIIQSSASDMAGRAFAKVLQVAKSNGIPISIEDDMPGIRPWNIIHDELCYVVNNEYVEPVQRILRDVMVNIYPECLVPIDIDLVVVERLSDKYDSH